MGRMESCDVCGGNLAGDDIVRAELSFGEGAMCPSPMTMHKACHEQASGLWKPDTESTCVVDTKYPETTKWTPAQR